MQPKIRTMGEASDVPLCRTCGGRCCQGSPGLWVDPERFFALFFTRQNVTLEQLRGRLDDLGLVLWEKTGVPIPAPLSLLTGCAFHSADGCRFTIEERPCQCLALVPNRKTLTQAAGCLCRLPAEFSREQAERRWQKYWQGRS